MLYNTKQELPESWGLIIKSTEDCLLVKQIMDNLDIPNSRKWSFRAAIDSIYIFSRERPLDCTIDTPSSSFLIFTIQQFLTKKPKNIEIY